MAGSTGTAPSRPVRIEFPDRRILSFDFPVIELARLEARDYVHKENAAALALASRMRYRQEEQEGLILDFAAALVLRQLHRRLGPLPEARHRDIEHLALHKVEALGEALLDLHTPEELARWLHNNAAAVTPRKPAKSSMRSRRP